MSKKRTRHERLNLPKLDGTKKAKKAYNRAYWRKVTSKKKRR